MTTSTSWWGVPSEKNFIDGLGTFTAQYRRHVISREQLLKNYIKSLEDRNGWSDKEKAELRMHAKQCLLREQGKIL